MIILNDEISEIRFAASSLAFSTLLAIIPCFIIVLAVLQSIGGLEKFYPQIETLIISYLKEATGSTVSMYVKNSLEQFQPRALGLTGGVLLLLTSLGLIRNIDYAFNRIWKIRITTPIYSRIWLYWIILVMIPLLLATWMGLKSVNTFSVFTNSIEQQFLFSIGSAIFLYLLFTIIPHTKVNFVAAAIPAIFAGAALAVVQKSFLWASLRFFKTNKIYGSLASVPIFLIWLLVVWYVILSGVAVSAYMQNRIIRKITA